MREDYARQRKITAEGRRLSRAVGSLAGILMAGLLRGVKQDKFVIFAADAADLPQLLRARKVEVLSVGKKLAQRRSAEVKGAPCLRRRAGPRRRDDGQRQDTPGKTARRIEDVIVHLAAEPLVPEGKGRGKRALNAAIVHSRHQLLRRAPFLHLRGGQ